MRSKTPPRQVGHITTKIVGAYPDGRPNYQATAHYGDPEHTGPKPPLRRATRIGPTSPFDNRLSAHVSGVRRGPNAGRLNQPRIRAG